MDDDLIARAQGGDRDAFEALATAQHPRLYRVALGVLGDPSVADDATQDALLAIWRDLPRLRDASRFSAWSYRLLVRICYAEAGRRRARLHEQPLEGHEPTAADEIGGVVQRDELARGFRRLSPEHRVVLVLRYMLDLPNDEIAEALEIPVGTVDSRLHRALKALRAGLEADGRAPTPMRREEAMR